MKKIVLFDFDGVLVDSYELSYQAAVSIHPGLTREQQKDFFEGNIYDAQEKLFEKGKAPAGTDEKFFAAYVPALFEVAPVPGAQEVLEQLAPNYHLIVVSSTISSPIQGYLARHGLDRHFDWIMGGDVHKSKTVKIRMVLDEYKARSEDCVFITDTLGDMREAAACGVRSIGVTWGFHERQRLEKGDFAAFAERIEDLLFCVAAVFQGRANG